MEKVASFYGNDTEVTASSMPKSQSLVTLELFEFHK